MVKNTCFLFSLLIEDKMKTSYNCHTSFFVVLCCYDWLLQNMVALVCFKSCENHSVSRINLFFKRALCYYFLRITGTPSPLSPTPSPSGSVGSVGSNGSNETMTTPSRNGKPSSGSNAMTSPVNVCIPQKIHSMTQQHVLLVNNLVYSQDLWDQAQPVVLEFRGKMSQCYCLFSKKN